MSVSAAPRPLCAALVLWAACSAAVAPACRDAITWPFAVESIWNTPLGTGAVFSPANLFAGAPGSGKEAPFDMMNDDDYLIVTSQSDPLVPWYNQGRWGPPNTYAAYCTVTGPLVTNLHMPAALNVSTFGNNNAAAILQPDGRTLFFMQPLYVCGPGAPVLALELSRDSNTSDIQGLGTLGGHGGSNLNAIGGTIRKGELLPGAPPIAHALKLEFYANLFYFRPADGNRSRCFRWPATTCDGYMDNCAAQPRECYNGTDPLFTPGALLAVPAAAASALNVSLRTAPARALLLALMNFGGYVADDAAWNSTSICTEHGVADEFELAYGWPYRVTANTAGPGALWYADQLSIFRALSVVVNNAPGSPGGGGAPLQPPPPPFCA